ncbi:MAG: hypothetical protein Fur0010_05930 [Bdellovibrio sp.]
METNKEGFKDNDPETKAKIDEVSLIEVIKVFTDRWKYLVSLALFFVLLALVKHKYFPIYPSMGTLIIKDQEAAQLNSFLKSVSGNLGGLGIKNSNDKVNLAIIHLETNNFMLALADKIIKVVDEKKVGTPDYQAFSKFIRKLKTKRENPEFRQTLASSVKSLISFSAGKSGQINIKVKSNNKAISVFLVNYALDLAKETLIEREILELNRAENYFQAEVDKVQKRLEDLEGQTIFKLQEKNTISLDAKTDETSKYLNELRKNINDTKIKIAENNMLLATLKKKIKKGEKKDANALSKFDLGNNMVMIEDENKALKIRLKTYESYLNKFGKQGQKMLPFQNEIEKMRNNYLFESKVYENLRDSLARIGLQKTFIQNSVEVLEYERLDNVRSQPGLTMMILIAIMLSQIVGFGGIYVLELFGFELKIKRNQISS